MQKTKIQSAWLKVEALSAAFGPFLELSPEELAAALNGETPLYAERVEILRKTISRVTSLMRQASAIHEATRERLAS